MRLKLIPLMISLVPLTLAACSTYGTAGDVRLVERQIAKKGMYWQRIDTTSAIWMQGEKAQQTLNRDISHCVAELGELERLGQIKGAFPTEKKDAATTADAAHQSLMDWDTPERDGALLSEQLPYTDFEGCMAYKGWERVQHVPYDVAKRAAMTYAENHVYLKSRTKYEGADMEKGRNPGPYDKLND